MMKEKENSNQTGKRLEINYSRNFRFSFPTRSPRRILMDRDEISMKNRGFEKKKTVKKKKNHSKFDERENRVKLIKRENSIIRAPGGTEKSERQSR